MQIEQFKKDILPLRQMLFYTAMKWLQNEADAEDAVQETLLRLWKIRDQLDEVVNFSAFASQMTKNICIDRMRTAKEHTEAIDFYLATDSETPYLKAERKDTVTWIKKIIERLPELQRRIIQLRDVEGYELQEIADITGTQIGAVTANLSRARKKVRNTFIKIAAACLLLFIGLKLFLPAGETSQAYIDGKKYTDIKLIRTATLNSLENLSEGSEDAYSSQTEALEIFIK